MEDLLNKEPVKRVQEFIKEFDRHWAGKVRRTREVFEVKQLLTK